MAETSLKNDIYQYCKNPHMRNLFLLLYETATGHDHDGTNSKAVTVGAPGAGSVTNTMMATDVKIGSLAALTTTANASIVAAINELDADIGALTGLTTTVKTSIVAAVNEIHADIGDVATLTTTAKTVVGAINELDTDNSSFATKTGAETLTNKHLTSPHITTMLIEDGDTGVILTSADQTNAAPTVTIPDIGDAADTFCMVDTAQTLTNKTLTTPVISTFYKDAGKTKLMTVPDVASDTVVLVAATQTLTGKTLTSPVITTMLINDGDTGLTVTSANQTHAAPTATIPDIVDAADTFVMADTAQTLTLKTLTTPVVASFYQDAGKTKLMTVPDTASDTLTANAATQTLTNKTLTAPAVTSPDLTFAVSAHDYAAGAADWTLSAAEIKTLFLSVSNSSGVTNIIAPTTASKVYILYNATATACTIKTVAGTGIAVAATKTAMVRCDGINYVRVTGDA